MQLRIFYFFLFARGVQLDNGVHPPGEGPGVEVVFLHCALAGGRLSGCGLEGLGVWWPKNYAIACRRRCES